MSKPTAIVALEPGPYGKPYCTLWMTGTAIDFPETDTAIATGDPGREATAAAEADSLLASHGWHCRGPWQRKPYHLEARCGRVRQRRYRKAVVRGLLHPVARHVRSARGVIGRRRGVPSRR